MASDEWMSVPDMAKATGATEYSVTRALTALGLISQGKKDISDRRRTIYPPSTLEKVKAWLERN